MERLIGTIRRECLDQLLFWTAADLETKLNAFQDYYNKHRTHGALKGATPVETPGNKGLSFKCYGWRTHCRGLYQTPIAASPGIRHAQQVRATVSRSLRTIWSFL
jgi:hypothetical protein